jgi:hypothetical protein
VRLCSIVILLVVIVLLSAVECRAADPGGETGRQTADPSAAAVTRINASLATALRYIFAHQSPDGAWRSDSYPFLADGPSLTPFIMTALFFTPESGADGQAAFRKGVNYLVGMVGKDECINAGPRGLSYPVFTSAEASRVVVLDSRAPERLRAQRAWVNYLRERQLARNLGWTPDDPEYGGWGFSRELPHKPAHGEPKKMLVESNLPSTLFAVAALRSAQVPLTDPIYAKVLAFVKRCQNFADDPDSSDTRYDDGGFFFIPSDPLQNKGGIAGVDARGRQRFCSYGSMTADGLRALVRCGLPPEHPRVRAALKWLETNFSVEHNPGQFREDREVLRDATYYYYCWSAAHAFRSLNLREIQTSRGKLRWAEALAEELMRRQRPDGSWCNRFTDAKEDDTLVSTPWAAAALALCRASITGNIGTLFPRPDSSPANSDGRR